MDLTGLRIAVDPTLAAQGEQQFNRSLSNMGRQAETVTTQIRNHFRTLRDNLFSFKTAITGLFVGLGIERFAQEAAEMQGFLGALRAATGSARYANAEFEWLRKTTERLGIVTDEVAESWSKLVGATQGRYLQGERTRQVFEGMATALRAFRGDSADVNEAIEAVVMVLSRGASQADQLMRALRRIPGAMNEMAASMGYTGDAGVTLFKQKLSSGAIDAMTLMEKFTAHLKEKFGPAAQEAANGLGGWRANLKNARRELEEALGMGILPAFTKVLREIVEMLRRPEFRDWARELGVVAGEAIRKFIGLLRFLADHLTIVKWALYGLVASTIVNKFQPLFSIVSTIAMSFWEWAKAARAAAAATSIATIALTAGGGSGILSGLSRVGKLGPGLAVGAAGAALAGSGAVGFANTAMAQGGGSAGGAATGAAVGTVEAIELGEVALGGVAIGATLKSRLAENSVKKAMRASTQMSIPSMARSNILLGQSDAAQVLRSTLSQAAGGTLPQGLAQAADSLAAMGLAPEVARQLQVSQVKVIPALHFKEGLAGDWDDFSKVMRLDASESRRRGTPIHELTHVLDDQVGRQFTQMRYDVMQEFEAAKKKAYDHALRTFGGKSLPPHWIDALPGFMVQRAGAPSAYALQDFNEWVAESMRVKAEGGGKVGPATDAYLQAMLTGKGRHGMKVPFTFGGMFPSPLDPYMNASEAEQARMINTAPVQKIRLADLLATQETVRDSEVDYFRRHAREIERDQKAPLFYRGLIAQDYGRRPLIAETDAGRYILDGHHRLSAARLNGWDEAEAKVMDLRGRHARRSIFDPEVFSEKQLKKLATLGIDPKKALNLKKYPGKFDWINTYSSMGGLASELWLEPSGHRFGEGGKLIAGSQEWDVAQAMIMSLDRRLQRQGFEAPMIASLAAEAKRLGAKQFVFTPNRDAESQAWKNILGVYGHELEAPGMLGFRSISLDKLPSSPRLLAHQFSKIARGEVGVLPMLSADEKFLQKAGISLGEGPAWNDDAFLRSMGTSWHGDARPDRKGMDWSDDDFLRSMGIAPMRGRHAMAGGGRMLGRRGRHARKKYPIDPELAGLLGVGSIDEDLMSRLQSWRADPRSAGSVAAQRRRDKLDAEWADLANDQTNRELLNLKNRIMSRTGGDRIPFVDYTPRPTAPFTMRPDAGYWNVTDTSTGELLPSTIRPRQGETWRYPEQWEMADAVRASAGLNSGRLYYNDRSRDIMSARNLRLGIGTAIRQRNQAIPRGAGRDFEVEEIFRAVQRREFDPGALMVAEGKALLPAQQLQLIEKLGGFDKFFKSTFEGGRWGDERVQKIFGGLGQIKTAQYGRDDWDDGSSDFNYLKHWYPSRTLSVGTSGLHPGLRGGGFGRLMYMNLARHAKQQGFRNFTSDTAVSTMARPVWESLVGRTDPLAIWPGRINKGWADDSAPWARIAIDQISLSDMDAAIYGQEQYIKDRLTRGTHARRRPGGMMGGIKNMAARFATNPLVDMLTWMDPTGMLGMAQMGAYGLMSLPSGRGRHMMAAPAPGGGGQPPIDPTAVAQMIAQARAKAVGGIGGPLGAELFDLAAIRKGVEKDAPGLFMFIGKKLKAGLMFVPSLIGDLFSGGFKLAQKFSELGMDAIHAVLSKGGKIKSWGKELASTFSQDGAGAVFKKLDQQAYSAAAGVGASMGGMKTKIGSILGGLGPMLLNPWTWLAIAVVGTVALVGRELYKHREDTIKYGSSMIKIKDLWGGWVIGLKNSFGEAKKIWNDFWKDAWDILPEWAKNALKKGGILALHIFVREEDAAMAAAMRENSERVAKARRENRWVDVVSPNDRKGGFTAGELQTLGLDKALAEDPKKFEEYLKPFGLKGTLTKRKDGRWYFGEGTQLPIESEEKAKQLSGELGIRASGFEVQTPLNWEKLNANPGAGGGGGPVGGVPDESPFQKAMREMMASLRSQEDEISSAYMSENALAYAKADSAAWEAIRKIQEENKAKYQGLAGSFNPEVLTVGPSLKQSGAAHGPWRPGFTQADWLREMYRRQAEGNLQVEAGKTFVSESQSLDQQQVENKKLQAALESTARQTAHNADAMDVLYKMEHEWRNIAPEMQKILADRTMTLREQNRELKAAVEAWEEYRDVIKPAIEDQQLMTKAMLGGVLAIRHETAAAQARAAARKRGLDEGSPEWDAYVGRKTIGAEEALRVQDIQTTIQGLVQSDPLRVLNDRMTLLNEAVQEQPELWREAKLAMMDAKESYERSIDDMLMRTKTFQGGAAAAFREYARSAKDAAQSANRIFGNFFQGLEDKLVEFSTSAHVKFGDLWKSLLSDINRAMIRKFITGPIADTIGKALGIPDLGKTAPKGTEGDPLFVKVVGSAAEGASGSGVVNNALDELLGKGPAGILPKPVAEKAEAVQQIANKTGLGGLLEKISGRSRQVPGTGMTVGELKDVGYSDEEIRAIRGNVWDKVDDKIFGSVENPGGFLSSMLGGLFGKGKPGGGLLGGLFGGLLGFAGGGVMSGMHAGIGTGNAPKIAVFDEGSVPEAYIPMLNRKSVGIVEMANGELGIPIPGGNPVPAHWVRRYAEGGVASYGPIAPVGSAAPSSRTVAPKVEVHIHGVTDFESFKKSEAQVRAGIYDASYAAYKRNA